MAERFWEKAVCRGDGRCWQWLGHLNPAGYGSIGRGGRDGVRTTAHRAAHELLIGPVPDGHVVDHLCENKSCVNPAHLEAVTQQDNMLRLHGQRESCRRGHPLDGVARSGGRMKRYCRTCRNAAQRARARQRSVR